MTVNKSRFERLPLMAREDVRAVLGSIMSMNCSLSFMSFTCATPLIDAEGFAPFAPHPEGCGDKEARLIEPEGVEAALKLDLIAVVAAESMASTVHFCIVLPHLLIELDVR